jgi:hypothetical protein
VGILIKSLKCKENCETQPRVYVTTGEILIIFRWKVVQLYEIVMLDLAKEGDLQLTFTKLTKRLMGRNKNKVGRPLTEK